MPSYNKKEFKESNINYLNKDFSSFKRSLIDYAKNYFPDTYKDFNETSPGMMLIEMSAYVGDVMSFYIDQQYREMLLPLSEERRNIMNMAKMFGYKVKPIVASTTELTFKSIVKAQSGMESNDIDYSDAAVWDKGIQVISSTDPKLIFETLDKIDFTITSSIDKQVVNSYDTDGFIADYMLERTVRAVSGETKTKTFTIGAPEKFKKIIISDTNVIDIISVVDSNGNRWYEVDYLAQDKVPVPVHYTQDNTRDNAYVETNGDYVVVDVPVPYSLSYIKTNKRFTRETNIDNTTSLVFGNGILKNGSTIDDSYLDLEQAGIVIPGQAFDLPDSVDPIMGDEYSTLGETPMQTTLTVTYRVGGGQSSNASAGELNIFTDPGPSDNNIDVDAALFNVVNRVPALGGRSEESLEEIRQKTLAFFNTQNRCVTKEDYEARVMNMDSRFGSIAKVYVSRSPNIMAEVSVTTYLDAVSGLLSSITGATDIDEALTLISDFNTNHSAPGGGEITAAADAGHIQLFILSYDRNKNLIGNPHAGETYTDNVPDILKSNISEYLENFRILTDGIDIIDGYIINFGVFFDVISHKYADKSEVKLKCIQKIKDYFNIDKMQFSQPIVQSQLEYELMSVDGVRGINHVTITQEDDYNASGSPPTFGTLYKYSFDPSRNGAILDNGTSGYGWKYDFESIGVTNGVILPPSPSNPGVFELKNPNTNIKGVVR